MFFVGNHPLVVFAIKSKFSFELKVNKLAGWTLQPRFARDPENQFKSINFQLILKITCF